MPLRVLVVDDSNFFRQRLKEMIDQHPELTVAGTATNGREAVEQARTLKPDLITMDFEMPVMDGITAVKHIMSERPVPILMFSSLTYEGARITLDALAAGATDFMPKDFGEVSRNANQLRDKLHDRLLTLGRQSRASAAGTHPRTSTGPTAREELPTRRAPLEGREREARPASRAGQVRPKILVIGASTGGPVALTEVLVNLPASFPLPIVLIQHMPENFTTAFAERLDRQCQIQVREAADGDALKPGLALLAPGGKQLMLDSRNGGSVKIVEDARMTYKPALDITFGSAAKQYGNGVLGVVLTGMGSDGREGARMLKTAGSTIWSQDEESCVIYGMPMAVAKAGLTDKVLSLKDIGPRLAREVS